MTFWRWINATDDRQVAAWLAGVAIGSGVGVIVDLWKPTGPVHAVWLLGVCLGFSALVLIAIGWQALHERDWRSGQRRARSVRETGRAYACLLVGVIGILVAFSFGF